ncbi:TonB-dependent siderophore receptor [Terrihabitans rhizophilus]|uniref:TonB-dependent siderophore receptor n=1 Tax=Terrihabitans rhizophilus TaxID=3092662 RepID=A0ABU4RM61_9HYPH|nr:TonB-dependent siderophore receptor [Terrihabitans sp. PJ23]MDX6805911.1 TonB-dependent siderophore receptor [Terrihabitans sp. PJ23]
MHRAKGRVEQLLTAGGHRHLRQTFLSGLSRSALTAPFIGGLLLGTLLASPASAQTAAGAVDVELETIEVQGAEQSGEGAATGRLGEVPPAYAGGQVATGGSLGILGTRSVLNTPFSTVNFTEKLIQDQQARTAADILINDPSVRLTTGSNGFDDTFQIRGFGVSSGDTAFNGLYGLIPSNRANAQYIQRIELLKGPAAFINGIPPGGSVGGSINIISKRAVDEPFTIVTPSFISEGNIGTAIDFNRRFGDNKEWGIRFNGVGRTGEASIEDGDWTSGVGALSVDYDGERFRWALDVITQNDYTDNFRPQMTIRPTVPFIPRPPDARSNWYPGTELEQHDHTIATFAEYDVTDWLTAYAGYGHRWGTNEQVFPDSRTAAVPATPTSPAIPASNGMDENGNFRVLNGFYDSETSTDSANAGLRAKFDTGAISHSLNVGFTGYFQKADNAYTPGAFSVPSNIYNPSPLPPITADRIDPYAASETTFKSYAASDTMSFFDDLVLFTAGVRHQQIRQQNFRTNPQRDDETDATSPLFGIVVKPLQNVSIYASYAEGLSQGAVINAPYANEGEILDPFKSEQQEVGVKVDWGRITTTAAIFQITRPTLITTADNFRAYDGEERRRGLELSAFGEIVPGLRGIAGVTFLDPELTNPANAAQRGNDVAGVPDFTASASLEWDTPWVDGLSVNGRVIYTSGSYLTNDNGLEFPDWTRVDLGARYETVVQDTPVTVRLNVENVFDETYWLTTGNFVTVASPRTFVGSVAMKF